MYSRVDGALKAVPGLPDPATIDKVLWIDVVEPSPEEKAAVERVLGTALRMPDDVDTFYVSDQLRASEGQVIMNALLLTGLDIHQPTLAPVCFIRNKGPLVTISRGVPDGLAWLLAECGEWVPSEAKDMFPAMLDMIIDHGINVLDRVSSELDKLNGVLFQHHATRQRRLQIDTSPRRRNRQLERILTRLGASREVLVKLRRSVLSFRRLVALLQERTTDEAILKRLVSFERELQSMAEAEVDLSSTAGFMLDGAVGYIGILQSKTINIMTIVGVLLTPPVLVASVYGMNFKHMPELEWAWGYGWGLGLMLLSAAVMYLVVRVRGWL
jgi:magnesium transporter